MYRKIAPGHVTFASNKLYHPTPSLTSPRLSIDTKNLNSLLLKIYYLSFITFLDFCFYHTISQKITQDCTRVLNHMRVKETFYLFYKF